MHDEASARLLDPLHGRTRTHVDVERLARLHEPADEARSKRGSVNLGRGVGSDHDES